MVFLGLLIFCGLLMLGVLCTIEIPELQEGEQIVYRSATCKEELYKLPLPQMSQLEDYYLTEVFDIKKGIYELIIGRYSNSSANNYDSNNFEITDSGFQRRKLESIIGNDDRTEVIDALQYPYSAISRMTYMCDGLQVICTSAFISQNMLISAASCLSSQNMLISDASFLSKRMQCRDYQVSPAYHNCEVPFGTFKVTKIIVNPLFDPVNTSRVDLNSNYGLLQIDEPVGARTGWFGFRTDCSETDLPIVRTAGYPDDFKGPVKFPKFNGTTMVTSTCHVENLDQCLNNGEDGLFEHECDTASGQVGAPMWVSHPIRGREIRGIYVRVGKGTHKNFGVYISAYAIKWISEMLNTN